jgi:peptidoglycan/xylan/chitin deacetylase (PgdA/CDA1 family)
MLKKILHTKSDFIFLFIFLILTIDIAKNASELYTMPTLQQGEICVPIIMYHHVKNNDLGKDVISPYEFEADLKYLKENGYTTITMTELINYVYDGVELPSKPIILSFDDGTLSTYKYVFPLLKEYNMKIVLSIIGKSADNFSRVSDININYSHITWDQIAEMDESGLVEFQNHSYNLHKVCNGRYGCGQKSNETFLQYENFLEEDIMILQEKLEAVIGTAPNTFAYPYGKYNDNTDKILKKLGFKASLTVKYGVNIISLNNKDELFGLKRICRAHNHPIGKLIKDGLATIKNLS